jgi:hypothetical protein
MKLTKHQNISLVDRSGSGSNSGEIKFIPYPGEFSRKVYSSGALNWIKGINNPKIFEFISDEELTHGWSQGRTQMRKLSLTAKSRRETKITDG